MSQHTRSQVLVALVTASGLSASSKMGKTYRQVGGKERRLAKNMRKLNVTWDVIRKVMERSPDTLNNIINPSTSTPKITGRPKKIPVKMLLCIVSHMLCTRPLMLAAPIRIGPEVAQKRASDKLCFQMAWMISGRSRMLRLISSWMLASSCRVPFGAHTGPVRGPYGAHTGPIGKIQ